MVKTLIKRYFRSLMRMGLSSLAVVLPKEWCDRNGCDARSPMELKEYEDYCVIRKVKE